LYKIITIRRAISRNLKKDTHIVFSAVLQSKRKGEEAKSDVDVGGSPSDSN
jgi:hypothetical protein